MNRAVHDAHPATPELIEYHIPAKDELARITSADEIRLKSCQLAGLHKLPRETLSGLVHRLPLPKLSEIFVFHQAAARKFVGKLIE